MYGGVNSTGYPYFHQGKVKYCSPIENSKYSHKNLDISSNRQRENSAFMSKNEENFEREPLHHEENLKEKMARKIHRKKKKNKKEAKLKTFYREDDEKEDKRRKKERREEFSEFNYNWQCKVDEFRNEIGSNLNMKQNKNKKLHNLKRSESIDQIPTKEISFNQKLVEKIERPRSLEKKEKYLIRHSSNSPNRLNSSHDQQKPLGISSQLHLSKKHKKKSHRKNVLQEDDSEKYFNLNRMNEHNLNLEDEKLSYIENNRWNVGKGDGHHKHCKFYEEQSFRNNSNHEKESKKFIQNQEFNNYHLSPFNNEVNMKITRKKVRDKEHKHKKYDKEYRALRKYMKKLAKLQQKETFFFTTKEDRNTLPAESEYLSENTKISKGYKSEKKEFIPLELGLKEIEILPKKGKVHIHEKNDEKEFFEGSKLKNKHEPMNNFHQKKNINDKVKKFQSGNSLDSLTNGKNIVCIYQNIESGVEKDDVTTAKLSKKEECVSLGKKSYKKEISEHQDKESPNEAVTIKEEKKKTIDAINNQERTLLFQKAMKRDFPMRARPKKSRTSQRNSNVEEKREVHCYDVGTSTVLDNNFKDVLELLKGTPSVKSSSSNKKKSIFHTKKRCSKEKLTCNNNEKTLGIVVKGIEPPKKIESLKNRLKSINENRLQCKLLSVVAIPSTSTEKNRIDVQDTIEEKWNPSADKRVERLLKYYKVESESKMSNRKSMKEMIVDRLSDYLKKLKEDKSLKIHTDDSKFVKLILPIEMDGVERKPIESFSDLFINYSGEFEECYDASLEVEDNNFPTESCICSVSDGKSTLDRINNNYEMKSNDFLKKQTQTNKEETCNDKMKKNEITEEKREKQENASFSAEPSILLVEENSKRINFDIERDNLLDKFGVNENYIISEQTYCTSIEKIKEGEYNEKVEENLNNFKFIENEIEPKEIVQVSSHDNRKKIFEDDGYSKYSLQEISHVSNEDVFSEKKIKDAQPKKKYEYFEIPPPSPQRTKRIKEKSDENGTTKQIKTSHIPKRITRKNQFNEDDEKLIRSKNSQQFGENVESPEIHFNEWDESLQKCLDWNINHSESTSKIIDDSSNKKIDILASNEGQKISNKKKYEAFGKDKTPTMLLTKTYKPIGQSSYEKRKLYDTRIRKTKKGSKGENSGQPKISPLVYEVRYCNIYNRFTADRSDTTVPSCFLKNSEFGNGTELSTDPSCLLKDFEKKKGESLISEPSCLLKGDDKSCSSSVVSEQSLDINRSIRRNKSRQAGKSRRFRKTCSNHSLKNERISELIRDKLLYATNFSSECEKRNRKLGGRRKMNNKWKARSFEYERNNGKRSEINQEDEETNIEGEKEVTSVDDFSKKGESSQYSISSGTTIINCKNDSNVEIAESEETIKGLEIFEDSGYITKGPETAAIDRFNSNSSREISAYFSDNPRRARSDVFNLRRLKVNLLFPLVYDDWELRKRDFIECEYKIKKSSSSQLPGELVRSFDFSNSVGFLDKSEDFFGTASGDSKSVVELFKFGRISGKNSCSTVFSGDNESILGKAENRTESIENNEESPLECVLHIEDSISDDSLCRTFQFSSNKCFNKESEEIVELKDKEQKSSDSYSQIKLCFYPEQSVSVIDMMQNVKASTEDGNFENMLTKDAQKQTEKQFFDALLAFYDRESELIKKMIRDEGFFSALIEDIGKSEGGNSSILHEDERKKEKKRGILRRFFKRKEKKDIKTFESFPTENSFQSTESTCNERESFYSFFEDDSHQIEPSCFEHLRRLAHKAKRHLEPMVKATISNGKISDKIKLAGFLQMLDQVAGGDFTFFSVVDNKSLEEKLKDRVSRMFEKVYRIADYEVKQKTFTLDEEKLQLLKMLVTEYHMGIDTHLNILSVCIGRNFIRTREQLEDAIILLMGQNSEDISLQQLKESLCIPYP